MKPKELENPMDELSKLSKDDLIDLILFRQTASCCPLYPNGLIGQKVRYREQALKKHDPSQSHPLPQCGYFIIKEAHLTDNGVVIVFLDNGDNNPLYIDTYSIAANYLEPVKNEKNT